MASRSRSYLMISTLGLLAITAFSADASAADPNGASAAVQGPPEGCMEPEIAERFLRTGQWVVSPTIRCIGGLIAIEHVRAP